MHTPAQLVTDLLDAMNRRQLDRIRDLVTDDFVDHGSPVAVLQVHYAVDEVISDGDTVAMKPAHFFRCRDGRLRAHWGIRDELDVLYQVGALAPPALPMPAPG
jgi:ketosteroid isomerase-like protein